MCVGIRKSPSSVSADRGNASQSCVDLSTDTSVATSCNSSDSGDRSSRRVRARYTGAHSCNSSSNSGDHRGSTRAGLTAAALDPAAAAAAVSTRCKKAPHMCFAVWLRIYWLRRLLSSRGPLPEQTQRGAPSVAAASHVERDWPGKLPVHVKRKILQFMSWASWW